MSAGRARTPPPPYLAESRVLVVDDAGPNRVLLVSLLRALGVGAWFEAANGVEALKQIDAVQPDLVLLDLMMPQLDGFEVCRRLRADPRHADLPVLVQTSLNRPEDRAEAFEAGATDYVSKPVNGPELLARVQVHLRRRHLIRDLRRYRERTSLDLASARAMQERLLPPQATVDRIAAAAGLRLESRFVPSSELGGDLWGIAEDAQGRAVLFLCDFSGHGVNAALNTFRLHALIRQTDFGAFDPAGFLAGMNRQLAGMLPVGQYATMLAGLIDPAENRFLYASAATPAPLVWLPDVSTPRTGDGSGLPLGILPDNRYETRSLPLPAGARLLLYSDGAVEIPAADSETGTLGEEGVARLAEESLRTSADGTLLPGLCARLWAASGGPLDDDLTVLALHRRD